MTKITESEIEKYTIELLEKYDYQYIYAPSIASDSKTLERLNSPELIANNEAFHRILTEGIKVTYQINSHSRGDYVLLIDFNNPENNYFLVVNQFTVNNTSPSGDRGAKRQEAILFVDNSTLKSIKFKNFPARNNDEK